jgi:hypothetical protein
LFARLIVQVAGAATLERAVSSYTIVYDNLQGPPNLNPVTSRAFETEDKAINFARSITGPGTELRRLELDGKTILDGAALRARVAAAGGANRGM